MYCIKYQGSHFNKTNTNKKAEITWYKISKFFLIFIHFIPSKIQQSNFRDGFNHIPSGLSWYIQNIIPKGYKTHI